MGLYSGDINSSKKMKKVLRLQFQTGTIIFWDRTYFPQIQFAARGLSPWTPCCKLDLGEVTHLFSSHVLKQMQPRYERAGVQLNQSIEMTNSLGRLSRTWSCFDYISLRDAHSVLRDHKEDLQHPAFGSTYFQLHTFFNFQESINCTCTALVSQANHTIKINRQCYRQADVSMPFVLKPKEVSLILQTFCITQWLTWHTTPLLVSFCNYCCNGSSVQKAKPY